MKNPLESAKRGASNVRFVDADPSSLPDDIDELKAALIAARAEVATEKANTAAVDAELTRARAVVANDRSLIALLNLEIEKTAAGDLRTSLRAHGAAA